MISLDNVNNIIKELGGDEIDAQLFNFIHDAVLDILSYKNRLNDLFDSRLEVFCSRYRCLKW